MGQCSNQPNHPVKVLIDTFIQQFCPQILSHFGGRVDPYLFLTKGEDLEGFQPLIFKTYLQAGSLPSLFCAPTPTVIVSILHLTISFKIIYVPIIFNKLYASVGQRSYFIYTLTSLCLWLLIFKMQVTVLTM